MSWAAQGRKSPPMGDNAQVAPRGIRWCKLYIDKNIRDTEGRTLPFRHTVSWHQDHASQRISVVDARRRPPTFPAIFPLIKSVPARLREARLTPAPSAQAYRKLHRPVRQQLARSRNIPGISYCVIYTHSYCHERIRALKSHDASVKRPSTSLKQRIFSPRLSMHNDPSALSDRARRVRRRPLIECSEPTAPRPHGRRSWCGTMFGSTVRSVRFLDCS
ncbi:hypothetical protein HYPSUDRAFT_209495 [Hypholoma sublateritium FD-334 SS-4]|uniref:Uncharacterized protein n=1 Tax=Hypholoma sublateritium (strain FD-334 SS-4) TaxID=945553 RepID=A0A0D2KG44_HYPSF|nr:hypothetical protein HYPSUDRAFT_209495 [Hypholoma sublateritium FD-334 SS-4]